jgi:hypothetical protein
MALFVGAVLLPFAACGDEDEKVRESDLHGSWNATKLEFTLKSDPSVKTDVIRVGGSFVLVLEETGSYTSTMTRPNLEAPRVATGAWVASGDMLTLTPADMPFSNQFDMHLSRNVLTLTGGDVQYDFVGHDVWEEAELDMVLNEMLPD